MTRSGMVEGAHVRADVDDVADHAIHIFQNVSSGDSNDAETLTRKQRVTSRIAPWLVTETMCFPIHFNDETPLQTGEIRRHLPCRKLSPELQSGRASA